MSIAKQVAEARAYMRSLWKIKAMRASVFPEWYSLHLEEKSLTKRLKEVREQRRAIEQFYRSK